VIDRRARRRLVALLGVGVALIAVAGPLDDVADRSLTGHMVQHVLLFAIAAPLLALGRVDDLIRLRPLHQVLASLRSNSSYLATPKLGVRRLVRSHGTSAITLVTAAQIVVMAMWHVPALFDAALAHPIVHATEHLILLGSAVAFWAVLAIAWTRHPGSVLGAVFAVSIACTGLGVAMFLADAPWYPYYAHAFAHRHTDALADQQLAGVVMWGWAGLAIIVGAIVGAASWLRRLDHVHAPRSVPVT